VSRRGHSFPEWDLLCEEIAHRVRGNQAVLDVDLLCQRNDGRSLFHRSPICRDWRYFCGFDLVERRR